VNDEYERIWKEATVAYFGILSSDETYRCNGRSSVVGMIAKTIVSEGAGTAQSV
jgi:hypothetical protein